MKLKKFCLYFLSLSGDGDGDGDGGGDSTTTSETRDANYQTERWGEEQAVGRLVATFVRTFVCFFFF